MFGLRANWVARHASVAHWQRSFVRCAAREVNETLGAWTQNAKLKDWVAANVKLMAPDSVHFCDGALLLCLMT
jgi:hypothetical protein